MPGGQHFQPNPSTSATKVTFMRSQSFSNALRKDLKNPSGKYNTLCYKKVKYVMTAMWNKN